LGLPKSVRMVEVGARDGLQNQSELVATEVKIELIERLCNTGIKHIEVGAFVSPKWIPLMADSAEVISQLHFREGTIYSALTPNVRGMEAALKSGVNEVAVFIAASESFSQKNTNCSIEEAIARTVPVIKLAKENSIQVRAYVSCVMSCPYEGDNIDPMCVAELSARMIDLGCYEVSLGDTNGRGTASKTENLVSACLNKIEARQIAVHFHNTFGQALANILVALQSGISVIDSSVAGLGGCPYAKGATGNVASEDVLYMLQGLGIETGIDMDKLVDTAIYISQKINVPMASNTAKAISNQRI